MASTNIKIFDENKGNIMADEAYAIDAQRVNGVQSGIASSQLQNKTLFQVSLMAYALAQIMNQNGIDANDYDAVSTFVNNLSSSLLQKVNDKASTAQAQAGTDNTKWMTPATVKAFVDSWWNNLYQSLTLPASSITGVLPGANGGTGTSRLISDAGPNAILRKVSDGNYVWYTNTANGAFYATSANGLPKFGTLPVAQGGTGQTSVSDFANVLKSNYIFGNIATGYWVGTGTQGASSPSSLALPFAASKLWVYQFGTNGNFANNINTSNTSTITLLDVDALTTSYVSKIGLGYFGSTGSDLHAKKSSDGKTVYWYNTSTSGATGYAQLNVSGNRYYWLAWG